MRKLFLKLSALLFVLTMGVSAAWADDQSTIYLASLKAQTSPASTGSGQVKLTWLDITGKPLENSIAVGAQGLNPTNPVGPAATAQMVAGTMIAIEGTEVAVEIGGSGSQIYMTSVVYFHAEAEPDNGSYLADWTFTDPQITRIDTAMGHIEYITENQYDPELGEYKDVTRVDEENSIPLRTPCFKVLPKLENSAAYPSMEVYAKVAAVNADPNNLYAVFNKYLLGNPVATSANVEAEADATANLSVTVEVEGDPASLDAADFATFTFTNNGSSEWSYDLAAALADMEVISAQKVRITIPVTYTYKGGGYGTKNSTMTVSMAGDSPSSLNISLNVVALDPARPEALLLEGKDDADPASGTLAAILETDISGYANPIIKLNKPVEKGLTFSGKNFTLDLNGNTAQAITISSGNVTIAFSSFGGSATSLTVNGGKAILNGGTFGSLTIGASGTVEQNGATITGTASNAGSLTTTQGTINGGLTSSKTLVMNGGTFKGTTAVTVSGGTAAINRGTIEGTTCGLEVKGGTATTKKLAAIKGATYSAQRTGGTLKVECGKFDGPLNGSINFTSGYFKTNTYGISTSGLTEMLVSAGVEYNEGYRYFIGTEEAAVANGAGVCRIGEVSYAKLEDAIAYANNNPSVENIVIFMTNDYTLPAGYYTLPANAMIVVPMSDTQEKEVNMTAPRVVFNDQKTETPYTSILPTEFRRLTFASGVNMNVFGSIELTCSQYASNEAYTGQPVGPYGHLVLEESCLLTLQSGSEVRAWGYVTGKGEMDARRGSKVREMFQLGDWKGAFTSVEITGMAPNIVADHSDKKIFPVTQYFIQNIESPVKYHPGAVLSTSATVSEGLLGMTVSMAATDIAIVGVSNVHQAIFLMDQKADAENTWVRKWYDSENDIQVYDINSAAHIGSMVLDMGDINLLTYGTVPVRLNSAHFDLPLTSNFKIHLLSGTMDFQQNTSLLPGAEVEVDKEATVTVAMDEDEKKAYDEWVDGDKVGDEPVCYTGALYVYDAEDWDKYAYCNEYDGLNMVKSKAYTKTVRYAPSWNGRPTVRNELVCPPDAAINVHGTFSTSTGFVYTSEHGANIFSSNEDAGTFIFNTDASEAGERTVYNVKGSGTFEDRKFYPAKLRNGDGTYKESYTDAENYAHKGDAYCYQNDKWDDMVVDEDDPCFMVKHNVTTGDVYYAKPQGYVAVAATKTAGVISGNADHTFSDAAGAGKLFILMDDCQWWEVENVDNLYHCLHPENDTYYYWDGEWKEKQCTITWKNWDGNIVQTTDKFGELVDKYEVPYGTEVEFLGTNPTRESNIDYTYDFTGWSPTPGRVTGDVTYTATFTEKPRMYTITFRNEGGSLIETQFLTHNEWPECENTPTKIGHTLIWSPALAAVTGDATYTATFVEDPPTEYAVTFFDYDGTTVLKQGDVAVGAMPVAPAIVNGKPQKEDESFGGKPATNEFTYEFDHWSPALEVVSATSAKSYTAIYREVAKTYVVRFLDEDGHLIPGEEYNLPYGAMPVCSNTPTKENNAEWTYGFAWTPQIQTVMASEDPIEYRATFPATKNKYTVTLQSNLNGVCTFTGAGTFDYGTTISNVAVTYNDTKYTFKGWSDGSKDAEHASFELTGDITLTANFEVKSMSNLEIAAGGTETLAEATEVKDLIITSNGSTSGQLIGASYLDIKGDAIFRLEQSFDAGTWYAVAVPWQVDIRTGVYSGNTRLSAGSQFYVIDFDANAYVGGSTNTLDYWKFLHQTTNTMLPGKLYMIYLTSARNSLDFRMKKGTSLITVKTSVALTGGSGVRANWNAIANPAVYKANLATGAIDVQKYNGNDSYITDNTENMIVGKPVFAQVNAAKNVTATVASGGSGMPAYRRAPQAETPDNRFVVDMTYKNKLTDRIIVQTTGEKEDEYVIGDDIAKMGISSKVAQMWMERYNTNLCKNTLALVDDRAEYPLSIFAPVAGEYILSAEQQRGDATLYLIRNGEVVANLSEGNYMLTLQSGNTGEYGLRIIAKSPQISTAIDAAIVDSKDAVATKVLIDNQVLIIRGDRVYTIDGKLLK